MKSSKTPPHACPLPPGAAVLPRAGLILAALLGLALAACGGGGGGSTPLNLGGGGITGAASNVETVSVDAGPTVTSCTTSETTNGCVVGQSTNSANIPYVTVTICAPGSTTNCQAIDHVLVDTGSWGLRMLATDMDPALVAALPNVQVGGQSLMECGQFADGYLWGTVRNADVKISGELAGNATIQLGNDSSVTAPSSCTSTGASLGDIYAMGAKGILGVGLFINDCVTGRICPAGQNVLFYFTCPNGSCGEVSVPSNQQVADPVALFPADNSGVILELPTVDANGAPSPTGALVFGLNTASNNGLATQTVFLANGYTGNFYSQITSAGGYTVDKTIWPNSFLDSGSNGIYLPGTTIPCDTTSSWFVPPSTVTVTANMQGETTNSSNPTQTGTQLSVSLQIANANSITGTAFNDLGAPMLACTAPSGTTGTGTGTGSGVNPTTQISGGVDWGLPMFFGKNVVIARENTTVKFGSLSYPGPLWAF